MPKQGQIVPNKCSLHRLGQAVFLQMYFWVWVLAVPQSHSAWPGGPRALCPGPRQPPLVHSGAGHPTASPLCPTVGQSMWQPVPFLATSVLPRITQPKMLWVSQLNQHSVIALFEERQTEWQKERVSFVMVTSLSGCCFLARFAGESQALAAPGAAAEQKGTRLFYFKHNFRVSRVWHLPCRQFLSSNPLCNMSRQWREDSWLIMGMR